MDLGDNYGQTLDGRQPGRVKTTDASSRPTVALHQYAKQPNVIMDRDYIEGAEPEPTMSVSVKANGEKINT